MFLNKPLMVLWYGAGQDSTDLLLRYIKQAQFREQFVGDHHFIVVMSDTGNEFDFTYDHVAYTKALCATHGVEFYHITPNQGYHNEGWLTLETQFERNHNIMGVTFVKSCSDKLKVTPNYKFLDDYLRLRYGFDGTRKRAFYQYAERFGKLRSIIGFAAGEESRCGGSLAEGKKDPRPLWMQRNVEHHYPLITLGATRMGCQESIRSLGGIVPQPSNCMMCPFASHAEVLFLHRLYPEAWHRWVAHEQRKLTKHQDQGDERNLGVKGNKTLPEYLAAAKQRYGDWTNEMLAEYRFSHGHNIKTKY